jgi:hypothetical protein
LVPFSNSRLPLKKIAAIKRRDVVIGALTAQLREASSVSSSERKSLIKSAAAAGELKALNETLEKECKVLRRALRNRCQDLGTAAADLCDGNGSAGGPSFEVVEAAGRGAGLEAAQALAQTSVELAETLRRAVDASKRSLASQTLEDARHAEQWRKRIFNLGEKVLGKERVARIVKHHAREANGRRSSEAADVVIASLCTCFNEMEKELKAGANEQMGLVRRVKDLEAELGRRGGRLMGPGLGRHDSGGTARKTGEDEVAYLARRLDLSAQKVKDATMLARQVGVGSR